MNTSFTLSILGLFLLAFLSYRGVDVSGSIVTLCAAYTASEAAKRSSYIYSSGKDPNCDTIQAIKAVEKGGQGGGHE
jgi:hypothetical protein